MNLMSRTLSILTFMALACPVGAQSTPSAQASSIPELFAATGVAPQLGIGVQPAALRSRVATLDVDLLRSAQAPFVRLSLFQDFDLVAEFEQQKAVYGDGLIWSGSIVGQPESHVLFSLMGDMVSGSITWADQTCEISSAGHGVYWIHMVDTSALPACGTDASLAIQLPPSISNTQSQGPQAGNPDIDVMMVYTTIVKNLTGGTTSIQSKMNLAIAKTNVAYAASGVTQEVVLVHTEEMVGYSEPSSFNQILQDLQGTNDGKMDNVHGLRTQYGADCVAMLCANTQYCGLAYLMSNPSASFAAWAFSVTNYSCMQNSQTLAHELGHNMGCAHDPQNSSAGSGAYSYSFGYRTPNNQYRTIMAYSPGGEIDRFSGPNVVFNGFTMGTSSQDNVRSLNNTASIVAGWRPTVTVGGPGLTLPNLVAGQLATLYMYDCAPNGTAYIYYSTTGTGPTSTPYGLADLSAPLHLLPPLYSNSSGVGSVTVRVPSRGSGVTAWLQGVDLTAGLWTSNAQTTVQ